ncbi:PEPxxWA-CTERM sorting domain-containing protein [Sphingomonas bacterium]|uniref:PEPxxWA-CTERM sorting domain-containing protein n=1 Tax=Sphingomonas bacterium TaxID=1895847 RepID=UPI0020C5F161|nr:PEPxxWA-CTERM sorting domain-containing protein [Sphingomonas bacterium]
MMKLMLATAAAVVGYTAANAVVLPQLDPVLLDTTFVSTSGTTPASINFVNHLSTAVDVYWINYSGNRVFYTTLAAMSDYVQPTFITHPWIIAAFGSGDTLAQGTGTLITGFLAQTPDAAHVGPDIANIGATGGTVPEPVSWALMVAGFGLVGAAARRRSFVLAV